MTGNRARLWVATAAAGALLVGAAACTAAASDTGASAGPATARMRVGLVEWGFTTSAGALVAGPVELEVTNAGSTPHDLQLLVDGEVVARTAVLRPGESETVTADLGDAERVQLLCTLPGHESQGMVDEIEVVTAAATDGDGRHSG